jgi:lambda family phage tail tape measure protein
MDTTDTPLETWTVAITADTNGLQTGLQTATTHGKSFSSALVTAFDGLVAKGKSLDDTFKSLALSLSDMALKAALKPLDQGFNSLLSGLLSGGGAAVTGFANGGVFSGGLPVPFADGGVIQSPISFPLGGGATGIAGEAGPEAIMPLTRGADGSLGVAAAGSGGPNVTFNVQTADAASFVRSQSQIAAMLARSVSFGQRNL